MKRFDGQWNWWAINRPRFSLADPYDGTIWVGLTWGNGSSDPVWSVSVLLGGLAARPLVAWSNWRWDRAYARQQRARS